MKRGSPIRIGVIGVGHLGKFHLMQLLKIPEFSISGIYDINLAHARQHGKKYNLKVISTLKELFQYCDAVCIVTPTNTHYKIANQALESSCHVFIEKPITDNLQDAQKLIKKANLLNKIIQVGHIERFNPAFMKLKNSDKNPKFIETHRLAPFNPRGNDVPVVLDLMIHDIDIILSLVNTKINNINANGVKVVSDTVDIANARLEFENGCIANLTASRISQKDLRKMRLFKKNNYITIDFKNIILEKYTAVSDYPNGNSGELLVEIGSPSKYILYNKPTISKKDALKEELYHFYKSIINLRKPKTDGASATEALRIALEIQKVIEL